MIAAGAGGDVEEQGGGPVGQDLGPRPATPGPRRRAAGCRPGSVSSPTASTRTRIGRVGRRPCRRRPGRRRSLATGRDSPVIIDSSSSAAPSTISPSAGTRAPERTSTTSPGAQVVERRPSRSSPSAPTRSASSGSSAARAARASWAWPRAFISCQWPSSMIVTSAASSHQKSRSNQPSDGGHRRDVGDGDRHGDQQHHPGLAVLDLAPAALEERPAAPEEDDRAEHRPDPLDAGEVQLVAEPVHDHVAGQPRPGRSAAGSTRTGGGTSRRGARRACPPRARSAGVAAATVMALGRAVSVMATVVVVANGVVVRGVVRLESVAMGPPVSLVMVPRGAARRRERGLRGTRFAAGGAGR